MSDQFQLKKALITYENWANKSPLNVYLVYKCVRE